MPAIERYQSYRIHETHSEASEEDKKFAILSGKYGIIEPDEEIPFYDELLREKDILNLLNEVENYLRGRGVRRVIYHTKKVENEGKQYYKLVKAACETLEIELDKRIIES